MLLVPFNSSLKLSNLKSTILHSRQVLFKIVFLTKVFFYIFKEKIKPCILICKSRIEDTKITLPKKVFFLAYWMGS